MGCPQNTSHITRHHHILAIAEGPPKGIAGQRTRLGMMPGHDNPGVQSTGQGNPYVLWALEIMRKISGKNLPEFRVKVPSGPERSWSSHSLVSKYHSF